MSVAAPSTAQKSAGNYPKHHLNVRGLRISIENPAGSTRSGTAPDGTEWSTEMKHHYGYIRGTTGKDKDHLDVFLGPEPHAAHPVHIVNQVNEDGEFDEHKVMLGFKSKKDAIEAYHANYEEGWRGADTVATMAFPKFRQWATSGAKRAPAKDIGKVEEPEGYQAGGLVKAATALEQKLVKAGLFDRKLGAIPASAENTNAMPKALEAAAKELGLDEELLVSGSNRPRTRGDDYTAWAFAGRDVPNAYGYANDVWGMRQGPNVQRSAPRLDVFVADPDRRVIAPEGVFGWERPKDMARKFAAEPRVLFRDVRDMEGSPGLAETAEEATARQTQHLIPNLRRSIDMGAVYPLGRPRGQQGYASGGSVPGYAMGGLTPLTNLGGSLSPAGTAALIGAPGSDLGYTLPDSGAFGADAGVSGNTAGGLSPGTIGQALGVAGQLSGTPELGLMGGVIGATSAASQGQYGPAGGLIGGMLGGPLGAAAGSLAGQYGSGTLSGRSVGNAVLGLGVPGYGLANGLSGGALGAGLFGSNGGWSNTGVHTASAPGVFGDWGATAGQTAVNNANNVAGKTGLDGLSALMGVTGAFGTAPGGGVFGGGVMGGDYGGAQYGAPGYDPGPATEAGILGGLSADGMDGGLDASSGMDGFGGYGADLGLKRGGSVKRYADGGSTNAAFGFYPQLGRRKPQNNDRTAAASVPLSAARGWLAGTLGLPGDITSLAKMGVGAVADAGTPGARWAESTNFMPTSEFYNEWLPGRAEGAANRFAEGAGNLFGGVGATTAVRPLERGALRAVENAMTPRPLASGKAGGQRGVFKAPGGNWLPGRLVGQVETLEGPAQSWGAGPFTKYVRNEFGTERDALRAQSVANKGAFSRDNLVERGYADTPVHPSASIAVAHAANSTKPFAAFDGFAHTNATTLSPRQIIEEATGLGARPPEWVKKLPADAKIYEVSVGLVDEFSHMFDYVNAGARAGEAKKMFGQAQLENLVRNDPNHPHAEALELIRRGLDIDPDKLSALDVPTASLKTAEWDKFLQGAKQSAELNKGIKSVLKTYPESGHQWVELAPEGLKAEGQAMKHCVGGYCYSVEDGSTRILSLRGTDGKPAVTVEVRPGAPTSSVLDSIPWAERNAIDKPLIGDKGWTLHDKVNSIRKGNGDYDEYARIVAKEHGVVLPPPSIVQIKGPANRAPSKDVLPMVQDLIRGTDIPGLETFSEVRDLNNAGLEKVKGDALRPDGYYTREETIDALKRAGVPDSHISGHLRGAGFGD